MRVLLHAGHLDLVRHMIKSSQNGWPGGTAFGHVSLRVPILVTPTKTLP